MVDGLPRRHEQPQRRRRRRRPVLQPQQPRAALAAPGIAGILAAADPLVVGEAEADVRVFDLVRSHIQRSVTIATLQNYIHFAETFGSRVQFKTAFSSLGGGACGVNLLLLTNLFNLLYAQGSQALINHFLNFAFPPDAK